MRTSNVRINIIFSSFRIIRAVSANSHRRLRLVAGCLWSSEYVLSLTDVHSISMRHKKDPSHVPTFKQSLQVCKN